MYLWQVLRLAEAHIKHEKEELKSLNVVLERNKQDSDQRYMALEARMRATEKDKAEFDLRIYREREQIRALEAALNDIRARSGRTQEMVQKAYSDEQVFLDHVRKLKASFAGDRARLEQEVQRVRAQLMQERQMREEAVHRESATLARYRASENTVNTCTSVHNFLLSCIFHPIFRGDAISLAFCLHVCVVRRGKARRGVVWCGVMWCGVVCVYVCTNAHSHALHALHEYVLQ
jgi:hypothetical protein